MTAPKPDDVIETIKRGAHRHIFLKPIDDVTERLGTMNQLERFVNGHNVSIRGWDFPHVSPHEGAFGYGDEFLWSCTDWGELKEYWRLFKNGVFEGLYAERGEDAEYQKSLARKAQGARFSISIVDVIYTLSEYVEFARRVIAAGNCSAGLKLTIEYENMANTGLGAEIDRMLSPYYICRDSRWTESVTLTPVTDFKGEARELTARFFFRFDLTLEADSLQSIQDEFFALKIGKDGFDPKRFDPKPISQAS